MLSLCFVFAVDVQLYRDGDIQLRRICSYFAASGRYTAQVDTNVSTRSYFAIGLIAVDIQLSRLIYRPGRHGCVVQKCFRSFLIAIDIQLYHAGDIQPLLP